MKEKETFTDLPSAPPPCGSKSYRILVVDDEKAVRDLHLELLTDAGYEVIAVADGALAWAAIQTQHFDLMITDNSMPKVTGIEVINKLIAANIGLPIIMTTGALPQHEFTRNPWLNNIAVLERPVSNRTLLSTVVKVLNEEKNKDALRSSEIRYRRLFEAAKDGILILNVENGRITDVNPYLIELLGFSKSEIVGKTVGELSPFKDIEPNEVMLDRLKRDGYVRYENLPLENNDNQHVAVEFVCNVYQEATAQVIQCNIRDITERKRAEDQKDQFCLELEKRVLERTAELEAFSGAVSHDLRAPLRHLASYLGELQEQTDQTFSTKNLELLTRSSQATKRMGNLIDDLLAFSRVGTASIKKTAVNLDELIRQTLNDYSPELKHRQIEWIIQPLGVARADPALLQLAFGNLISNAVKFTNTSGTG
jgi:PAS domain S-box-containing protein